MLGPHNSHAACAGALGAGTMAVWLAAQAAADHGFESQPVSYIEGGKKESGGVEEGDEWRDLGEGYRGTLL